MRRRVRNGNPTEVGGVDQVGGTGDEEKEVSACLSISW